MEKVVEGAFDVKLATQPVGIEGGDAIIGRRLIDKRFHGPLDATSKGQMLAFMNTDAGSAAYVALEQVTGKLEGRAGTFLLHHVGNASAAGQTLSVGVAVDSGTGALKGLAGSMQIIIEAGGKHFYRFSYELPEG